MIKSAIGESSNITFFSKKVINRFSVTAFSIVSVILGSNFVLHHGWVYSLFLGISLFTIGLFPRVKFYLLIPITLLLSLFFKDYDAFFWEAFSKQYNVPLVYPLWCVKVIFVSLFFISFYIFYTLSMKNRMLKNNAALKWVFGYLLVFIAWSFFPFDCNFTLYLLIFLIVSGKYLWFVCYALLDRFCPNAPPWFYHLGIFAPFGLAPSLPFSKGDRYLSQVSSRTQREQAVLQLKGGKLILRAIFWFILANLLEYLFYHQQNMVSSLFGHYIFFPYIEEFSNLLHSYSLGSSFHWAEIWASVILCYIVDLLRVVSYGHCFVGILWVSGFHVALNTNRPFMASSIADYYRRYLYYYYELIFELFYYPFLFLPVLKKMLRLKVFFAVLFAAGFGNFVFHFIFNYEILAGSGPRGFIRSLYECRSFVFYYFIFSVVLAFSVVRSYRNRVNSAALNSKWRFIVFTFPVLMIFLKPLYATGILFRFHLFATALGF